MGLLDGMMPGQPAQAPQGGLLGNAPQSAAPAGAERQLPPELMQAIEQLRGAPPEQRQAFVQHIQDVVQKSPKDAASKQTFMQLFTQAMGGA